MEAGQTLVLYTDGITEAENMDGEEFGQERFAKCVLEGFDLPAKELIEFVFKIEPHLNNHRKYWDLYYFVKWCFRILLIL